MADPEHLAELLKGVESWNQWRTNHHVDPKFRKAGLARVNLERARFEGADFQGADLKESILREAVLVGANLKEANLAGVDLRRANLKGAILEQANLTGAHLQGAVLQRARVDGAVLRGADLDGADLKEAHLQDADLSEASIQGTQLQGANLAGAHLIGANLSDAALALANLERADFERATLQQALLQRAYLFATNLKGANLEQAILIGANLERANLIDANLAGAQCGQTSWAYSNLIEAVGVSQLLHRSASHLSTDTLVLSKGRLPVEFLKGCGLADWEIENAKLYDPDLTTAEITEIQYRVYDLLARGPIQISPVFISYSHGDTEFVEMLATRLDMKGVRFWRDVKDATAGRLDKVIERGISLNPTLLLVLSERAIESDWVEFEVDKAVQLSKQLKRDVLCPIALDKTWLESDRMSGNLRAQIRKYFVLDFSGHGDPNVFDAQFRRLLDGLRLHYRDQAGVSIRP